MDNPGFELHPDAVQDITDIWQYIALDNLAAAGRFRGELLNFFRNLARFPRQGHERPDLTSRPLRFQLFREYLIAYMANQKPLIIVAIIHGRRSPHVMASILRDRD